MNGKDSGYALALANRSAVQMRFGTEGVIHALEDIERALKAGHPTPIKLMERKITCYFELGMFTQIDELLQSPMLSEKMKTSLRSKLRAMPDHMKQNDSKFHVIQGV